MLLTPLAFAGLVILWERKSPDGEDSSSAGGWGEEVTIIEFNDAGKSLGLARVKKVTHSS